MSQETIEQLTVDLDLNTREFDRKSKKTEEALRDTRNRTAHTARSMSLEGTRAANFFKPLIAGAIGFIGVTTGSRGLINFAKNMTDSAASLGRFSTKVGMGVKDVQAWRMAADEMGISADGMDSALKVMSDAKNQYLATGETPAWMKPFNIKMDSPDSMLLQLAENSKHLDASMRSFAFEQNGLGGIAPILMMQRSEIESILNLKKQNNLLDDKQVKKAQELQAKLSGIKTQAGGVGREIYEMMQPKIEKALESMSALIAYARTHKSEMIDFFSGVGAVIGGVFVSGLLAAATPLVIIGAKIAAVTAAIGFLKSDHDKWLAGSKSFVNWELWETQAENAKAAINKVQASIKEHGGVIAAVKAETSEFIDVNGYQQQANDITRIFDGLIALNDRYGFSFTRLTKDWQEFKDMMAKLGEIKLFDGDKQISLGKLIGNFTDGITDTAKHHLHWAADKIEGAANEEYEKVSSLNNPKVNDTIAKFQDMGWTKEQATGITANIFAESAMNPQAVGDNGNAYGLAQWQGDRQKDFKDKFGHDIKKSTYDEQLEFIDFELRKGKEKAAGYELLRANNARQAAIIVSKKYERPAATDKDAANRGGIANAMMGGNAIDYSGIKLKSSEAISGGRAEPGTVALAKELSRLAGDKIRDFTAFNDKYHQDHAKSSGHTKGLKFDIALKNPEDAAEIIGKINEIAEKSGVQVKTLNEYKKLSKHGTGGHIDVGFKNSDDASKFYDFYKKKQIDSKGADWIKSQGFSMPLASRHSTEAAEWEKKRWGASNANDGDYLKFTNAKMPAPKPEWMGGQQNTNTTEINIDNINISGTKIKDADSLVSGLRERVNKSIAVHGVRAME